LQQTIFDVYLRNVVLLAMQLYDTDACHVQVSDAGTFYTSAVTTSGEVRCEMPMFPLDTNTTLQLYNWTMYLSSDNSTWSNGTQMLVYDPLCVACGEPENETGITCLPSEVNQSVASYRCCV